MTVPNSLFESAMAGLVPTSARIASLGTTAQRDETAVPDLFIVSIQSPAAAEERKNTSQSAFDEDSQYAKHREFVFV